MAETPGTSDSLSKAIAREVVDAVAAADGDVYAISRILTDSLSLSDSIVAELIVLFGRIARPRVALLSPPGRWRRCPHPHRGAELVATFGFVAGQTAPSTSRSRTGPAART